MEWLTEHKIPLGRWINGFVDLLNDHAAWLFDFTSDVLGFLIDGLIVVMQWCPPLLLIALFAALAYWLHRSWKLAALLVDLGDLCRHLSFALPELVVARLPLTPNARLAFETV